MNLAVSFVIPTYNASDTIDAAIRSLQRQSNPSWEAIVVDDGSTDDTPLIIRRAACSDKRVRCIRCDRGGVSRARNDGMKNALGQYVAFLDSDDVVDERYVESVLASLGQGVKCDLLSIGFTASSSSIPSVCEEYNGSPLHFLVKSLQLPSFSFACWRFVYRTRFIRDNDLRFSDGRASGEDQEFTLKALLKADTMRTCREPHILYHYNDSCNASAVNRYQREQFDYVEAMKEVAVAAERKAQSDSLWIEVENLLRWRIIGAVRYAISRAFINGACFADVCRWAKESMSNVALPEGIGKNNRREYVSFLKLWKIKPEVAMMQTCAKYILRRSKKHGS